MNSGRGVPADSLPSNWHCPRGDPWSPSAPSPSRKSLPKNTRSGGISQGRASAAAAGGAKRRAFTDAGAEGTARQREKGSIHRAPLFSTRLRT